MTRIKMSCHSIFVKQDTNNYFSMLGPKATFQKKLKKKTANKRKTLKYLGMYII